MIQTVTTSDTKVSSVARTPHPLPDRPVLLVPSNCFPAYFISEHWWSLPGSFQETGISDIRNETIGGIPVIVINKKKGERYHEEKG